MPSLTYLKQTLKNTLNNPLGVIRFFLPHRNIDFVNFKRRFTYFKKIIAI